MKEIKKFLGIFFLLTGLCLFGSSEKTIVVGISADAAPFSFKNDKGEMTGIVIELWDKIAKKLNINYKLEGSGLKKRLENAKNKKIDMAASPTTINSSREAFVDFSHPFYKTGLGIATNKSNQALGILALVSALVNKKSLLALALLVAVIFLFGSLAWFFEHKENSKQYRDSPKKGLWDGFWWSAVTLATVGYGDKAPRTFAGRVVGLVWMMCSVVILAFLTASIASVLTVSSLQSKINSLEDLKKGSYRVGTYKGTSAESFLKDESITYQTYTSTKEGIKALADDEIDAFVDDKPFMQYAIKKEFSDKVFMTKAIFSEQNYGFFFPQKSPLREKVNKALLEILEEENYWNSLKEKYLGH